MHMKYVNSNYSSKPASKMQVFVFYAMITQMYPLPSINWSTATYADLLNEANQWTDGEFVDSFVWTFQPKYPASRFAGTGATHPTSWKRWLAKETTIHAEEGRDSMYSDMRMPIQEPIIVVEYPNRKTPIIWDGYHRVASCFAYNHKTLPAIVGKPKNHLNHA